MPNKFRLLSVLALTALIVVAGCSVLTPKASGNNVEALHLTCYSYQINGGSSSFGFITIDALSLVILPQTIAIPPSPPFPKTTTLYYGPADGYYFVRWQASGPITIGNPGAQSTTVTFLSASQGTITAFYQKIGQTVGGVVLPTSILVTFAPYLAMIGLVAATAAVAVKKRRN